MNAINTGGPAFPQLEVISGERDGHGDLIEPFTSVVGGMSKREIIAMNVLSGMCHDLSGAGPSHFGMITELAEGVRGGKFLVGAAVNLADALLEELAK